MRLRDLEQKANSVLREFITKVYPFIKAEPPTIVVLDDDQFEKKRADTPAKDSFYNILERRIYLRGVVVDRRVCHEVEHWAQASKVGPIKYIEELRNPVVFLDYEGKAIDASYQNYRVWNEIWKEKGYSYHKKPEEAQVIERITASADVW